MDRIDRLEISSDDKEAMRAVETLRRHLRRHHSPRARELKVWLDEFTGELTGDKEFFSDKNHGIGKNG